MTNEANEDYVCIVATKQVPPVIGSSQASDPVQILDPRTGSILSSSGGGASLKVGSGVGIHSISSIPIQNQGMMGGNGSSSESAVYIAYGGKSKDDMHAYLVVQGSTSSPQWKCRLPEYMEGGIAVSPCGNYIVGAGRSGNCYCWSTIQEGELLRIWSAHYRPVQSMIFSDCGFYLVTGGADGIVNVWSLMDIVARDRNSGRNGRSSLNPIRTWSEHQLPISALHSLPSSRIVSTSIDRQVVIMELFSGQTLAKIAMPSAIRSVTADFGGHRLILGSVDGAIYSIDLDAYAIATTSESAKVISNTTNSNETIDTRGPSLSGSLLEETVLGVEQKGSKASYVSELRGHEGEVASLAFLENNHNDTPLLVSGGLDGSVKIWDISSRCCIRTLFPWSSTGSATSNNQGTVNARTCACSSVIAIPRESMDSNESTIFASQTSRSSSKRSAKITDLIKPLQRFPKERNKDEIGYVTEIVRPLSKHVNTSSSSKTMLERPDAPKRTTKRQRTTDKNVPVESDSDINMNDTLALTNEVEELKNELALAKETIQRWQKVNNKLAIKLKKATSSAD